MTELVREDHESVVLLRFSGSERLNAFTSETYAAFDRELGRLADESQCRALILTGAGRAFSSGQDLDEADAMNSWSEKKLRSRLEQLQTLTRRLRHLPMLLIAAVNGPAVGFGAEVTLACDVRFASEEAYFMFPELSKGLYFTNATLELLPALTGASRACELLFSGERWPASAAMAAGFLSRVVPGDQLLPEAQRFAAQIAKAPNDALLATLKFLRRRHGVAVEAALQFEVETFLQLRSSAKANQVRAAGDTQ
jgi:2-(1,2-epoxy-1,2-dihydrophenyl)acetyl-CoA isomerase